MNKAITIPNDLIVMNYDNNFKKTNRVGDNRDSSIAIPTSLNTSRVGLNNGQSESESHRKYTRKKIALIGAGLFGAIITGFGAGLGAGYRIGYGAGMNDCHKFNDTYGNVTNSNNTYDNITNPNDPYFNETLPQNNTYGNVSNPNNATSRFKCDDGFYFFDACNALGSGCFLTSNGESMYYDNLANFSNNCVRAAGDWEGNATNKLVGCTDYTPINSSVPKDNTEINAKLYCKNNLTNKDYTLKSKLLCKSGSTIKSDNGNGCIR
jgi:hypothetical protein